MPSTQSRSPTETEGTTPSEESGTRTGEKRILVAKASCLRDEAVIVCLRHPRTSAPASFLLGGPSGSLQELRTYSEEHRAWFVGSEIESKGCVYLATPADPVLVLLPYLRKAAESGKKVPIDHCVVDAEFPEVSRLLEGNVTSRKRLERVADAKGSADLNVWQFNETKTLSYLSAKVRRLSAALKADGVDTEGGATSGAFVQSKNKVQDESAFLRFAFGILTDSLESDLADKLAQELNLPKEEKADKGKKRDSIAGGDGDNEDEEDDQPKKKRKKTEEPLEDYSKGYKKAGSKSNAEPNAKQKALAQAATGSKNIMSFFKKK